MIVILTLVLAVGTCGLSEVNAQEPTGSDGEWYPNILEDQRPGGAVSQEQTNQPYLPDFSYAGYRWGEEPIPNPDGNEIDVTEFGALPDDGQDDTPGIRAALRAAQQVDGPVVVQFPSGRFIVRKILFLERSNLVLKGAGDGGTELHFPRPLADMETPGEYDDPLDRDFSPFSWRGGVIWTRDPNAVDQKKLGRLIAGRRGHHMIKAQRPITLQRGEVVQIKWFNREGKKSSLLHHIYCTSDVQFGKNLYEGQNPVVATQEVTVQEVDGNTLQVKEPLLHDLRGKWGVTLHTIDFLEEVGIENLRITFPEDVEYGGHHNEAGFNGIYLTDLKHSWVRDVTVENADSGILSTNSKNFTIKGVNAGTGRWGHYSVHLGDVYGALVTDFTLYPTLHNPSFNTRSRGSVYSDGFILSPVLDQHMGINHQNMFDNIRGRYDEPDDRLFVAGGSGTRWGPTAGAFNTFWNIQAAIKEAGLTPVEMRDLQTGAPHARLVGVRGENVPIDFDYGPEAYIEGKNRDGIAVESLYNYQLEQRLAGETIPSLAIYDPLDGTGFEEEEPVSISAEVRGDFEPERVRFFVDGEEVGTDTNGEKRWSTTWEDPSAGAHSITATAEDGEGNTLLSRPLTCTGEPVRIWVGEEGDLLQGSYPNPFREQTTIEYLLPETQHVRLDVFDVLGRKVRTLVNEVQFSGRRRQRFEATNLASGTYYYRLDTQSSTDSGKVVLVK